MVLLDRLAVRSQEVEHNLFKQTGFGIQIFIVDQIVQVFTHFEGLSQVG